MATNPPSAELMEILRVRVGLEADDTSKDDEIIVAYLSALSWVEFYTDRFLEVGSYTESFTHFAGRVLSLRGYPVEAITNIAVDDGSAPSYHLEARNGLIHFDGFITAHEITVAYDTATQGSGVLQMAVLMLFDIAWANLTTGPGTAAGTGAVKSIASDGARVEFDVAGGAGETDASSGMPTAIASMLHMLRRESV